VTSRTQTDGGDQERKLDGGIWTSEAEFLEGRCLF